MKIKITTIYAAQILGYMLSKENGLTTANEIVEKTEISYQYCMKIMNEMKRAGLLESEQGRNGGYRLKKSAESITVYDVMKIFEAENICIMEEKKLLNSDPFKIYMEEFFAGEMKHLKKAPLIEIYHGQAMSK